jgi:hypothetical protein
MLCEMPQALDVPWSPIVSAAAIVSVTRLKGVLEPGARVTLITTAYYSGGWVTNPEYNSGSEDGAATPANAM